MKFLLSQLINDLLSVTNTFKWFFDTPILDNFLTHCPWLGTVSINSHQIASMSFNQHQSASISINKHQWALISISEHQLAYHSVHQSASISISQNQSASVSLSISIPISICQYINQHQWNFVVRANNWYKWLASSDKYFYLILWHTDSR